MTIRQYKQWHEWIIAQNDLVLKLHKYNLLCNVYIQDMWLDRHEPVRQKELCEKTEIMFDLQGHIVK